MVRISFISILTLALLATGCTAALPAKESQEVCAVSLQSAEKAAEEAALAAEEAKIALAGAEKLYAEAKLLAEEVKKGTKECSALVAKVEKKQATLKRLRTIRRKTTTAKPVIEESQQKASPREPSYPKYSPSDAPPGWKGE
jgi:hypothetical protein